MGIVVNINNGQDFEPLSEGSHAAVLADVVDLGLRDTDYGPKEKVRFLYLTDEADERGQTRIAKEDFNKSLGLKSKMRPVVEKLLGRELGEEKNFDVTSLIGTQTQIIVQHSEGKDGKVWANIVAHMKPNPKVRVSIPQDFQTPDGLKGIKKAATPAPGNNTNRAATVRSAGGGAGVAAAVYAPAVGVVDDDIPF